MSKSQKIVVSGQGPARRESNQAVVDFSDGESPHQTYDDLCERLERNDDLPLSTQSLCYPAGPRLRHEVGELEAWCWCEPEFIGVIEGASGDDCQIYRHHLANQ